MGTVSFKSIEHHALLPLYRARSGFVKLRTAQANQIKCLLGEFGIVLPLGIVWVAKRLG
ncbi:MAG: transposase [Gammaproteobacteria bacterium]|jgi:transposase